MDDDRISSENSFHVCKETNTSPRVPEDIDTALSEVMIASDLFFNNNFQKGRDLIRPLVGLSMYHTVCNCIFQIVEELTTFEPENIKLTLETLTSCLSFCHRFRRKKSFSESFAKFTKGRNRYYDQQSAEEIHAELCYAETLLFTALLTYVEDPTLVKLIRSALKIRTCINTYKECQAILNSRNWAEETHKLHFESGVRLGIGSFNLLMSFLPSRVKTFLAVVGYTGNSEVAMEELLKCYELENSFRHNLSIFALLTYNLYVANSYQCDLGLCEDIVERSLNKYPNGALFLFFKGRLEFIKGNVPESCDWYIKCWKSQRILPQFHRLCFMELIRMYAIMQNWEESINYVDALLSESNWFLTIYTYQKACLLLMKSDTLTEQERFNLDAYMNEIPVLEQKQDGKPLPLEEFCVQKSKRYFAQDKFLMLPALEFIFVCDEFRLYSDKYDLCTPILEKIDRTIEDFEAGRLTVSDQQKKYDVDNYALLLLLKAASLHQMKRTVEAEEAINKVLFLEKSIIEDVYLLPYALVELASILREGGEINKSIRLLKDAYKNYKDFSMECALKFKIQLTLMELKKLKRFRSSQTDGENFAVVSSISF